MRLEQRKSPRLETRVGNKGLIAISKPPFLRVVMIISYLFDYYAAMSSAFFFFNLTAGSDGSANNGMNLSKPVNVNTIREITAI